MQGKVQSERKKGNKNQGKVAREKLFFFLAGRLYLRKVARRSLSENIDIGAEGQSTDLAGP